MKLTTHVLLFVTADIQWFSPSPMYPTTTAKLGLYYYTTFVLYLIFVSQMPAWASISLSANKTAEEKTWHMRCCFKFHQP